MKHSTRNLKHLLTDHAETVEWKYSLTFNNITNNKYITHSGTNVTCLMLAVYHAATGGVVCLHAGLQVQGLLTMVNEGHIAT